MIRNNFILIAILLVMTSCSLFKNRSVALKTTSMNTELHTDSSVLTKGKVVDNSVTTTTEVAKGVAYTKPKEAETSVDMSELLTGLQVVKDSGLVKITQSYDSITKQIKTQVTIKPDSVLYDINKITVTKNDIVSDNSVKTSVSKDKKSSQSTKDKETVSKTDSKLYIFLGVLGVIIAAYVLLRKKAGL